ncbi:MAG TPA: hypothetical protein DIW82_01595, partial [Corynebacterium nuruki]|nr:hypothetical protein [Corynebacterium nuruki]
GFGGTNAHVVLVAPEGAAPASATPGEDAAPRPALFDRTAVQDNGTELPHLLPVSGLLPSRRRTAAADLA